MARDGVTRFAGSLYLMVPVFKTCCPACQKPKDLGYSYELWTTRLFGPTYPRACGSTREALAWPALVRVRYLHILSEKEMKLHKITYYLERRDSDFDVKMAQVLQVYQQVEWVLENNGFQLLCDVLLSYDEKPGWG